MINQVQEILSNTGSELNATIITASASIIVALIGFFGVRYGWKKREKLLKLRLSFINKEKER